MQEQRKGKKGSGRINRMNSRRRQEAEKRYKKEIRECSAYLNDALGE